MTAPRRPTAQYPTYRFGRRVALPVLTLLAAAMLAVIAFVSYSAVRQSRDAQQQSARATRGAVGMKVEEIARTAQDYAWWNDSVHHLDLDFDLAWADSNVGWYIYETFGYDVTFVIGRDDRTRYTAIEGERRTANAFELAPGLEALVAAARRIPRDQPGTVSGYLMVDGVLAIVGASPITPEPTEPVDTPGGPRPVLVYAEALAPDILAPIAEGLGLADLRVIPPQVETLAMLPLSAPDRTDLGGLIWQPPPLGREFIRDILPSLVLAFGLIAGFACLVLFHARKASLAIGASEARFRDVADASADWIWETDAEGLSFSSPGASPRSWASRRRRS